MSNTFPPLPAQILASLGNLLALMQDVEEKTVKEWLPETLKKDISLTVHECNAINHIGQTSGINGVQLSEKLNMTRGGTSKILTKIGNKGLIKSFQSKENKKEIYYELTKEGSKIFTAHVKIQQQLGEKLFTCLSNHSEKDLLKAHTCLESLEQVLWEETA